MSPEKPLRIAQVVACPFPADHGTPGAVRELVNSLAQEGHEVHIVTYPIGKKIYLHPQIRVHRVAGAKKTPVRVGPFFWRFLFDALLPSSIARVVRKYDLELIHAHNYESLIAGVMVKRFCARPLIYQAVNLMEEELPTYNFLGSRRLAKALGKFLDRFFPLRADLILANTERLKKFFLSLGVPENKIEVLPTGIKVDFFASGKGEKVRENYGLYGKKIVLYTGTFDAFQGLDLLLEAFPRVRREEPSAVLLLVGGVVSPEQVDFYRQKSRRLGISEAVILTRASLEEVGDYLAAAEVAVCPRTVSAGMPVKILNYLAARKPVVTFRETASFLRHGEGVWFPEKTTPEALAEAIIKLLRERDLARQLGEKGFEIVKTNYSIESVCRKLINIYHAISREGKK